MLLLLQTNNTCQSKRDLFLETKPYSNISNKLTSWLSVVLILFLSTADNVSQYEGSTGIILGSGDQTGSGVGNLDDRMNTDIEIKFKPFQQRSILNYDVVPPKFQIMKHFLLNSNNNSNSNNNNINKEQKDVVMLEDSNHATGGSTTGQSEELFVPFQVNPAKLISTASSTMTATQLGGLSGVNSATGLPAVSVDGSGSAGIGLGASGVGLLDKIGVRGLVNSAGGAVGIGGAVVGSGIVGVGGLGVKEEKPKVVKKFSLADYKKKSKGVAK
ncbi:unnamed protein product [Ambrosiozyma monospora]|uniref:Unnamed protein product n=1 Tax=Ambrosiozyma monospora TaxID=43982 RepID=A0ACB5TL93_AMBMO|nr:unnamed protein product [Ambrosiozyma monospora]